MTDQPNKNEDQTGTAEYWQKRYASLIDAIRAELVLAQKVLAKEVTEAERRKKIAEIIITIKQKVEEQSA
jgi:hypothetical protein